MTRCHCALPASHCICDLPPLQTGLASINIWLHPNESERPTNTARIAAALIEEVRLHRWQRGIATPGKPEAGCLLFPADRPPWPEQIIAPAELDAQTPVLLLDGSWKECRKMLRQTPWLQRLPRLRLTPDRPSRYPLRRGADPGQLCTAEAIAELLRLRGQPQIAATLEQQLQRFYRHYQAFKSGHPARDAR
ncbi:tRNA-uridine aminocarboxypropyltransferase [Motiliproteus sediminis]|uniref:tRNA-uridine aminocarboxypropyltransferase n=1 Tax=Motiliproteus sediminis TaxID=1468178 RepID=UPI001AEFB0F2|nr:DTW domain-containing protein [Motiliproteus sediminis]